MPPTMASSPLTLNVEVFGSGPALVALHGFGGSIYSWHSIRAELSASHTVHALDMKGSGLSPKPRDGRYSVYDQSALVLDYIARNHLTNVTVLGHSFGGGVARATARRFARCAHHLGRHDRVIPLANGQRLARDIADSRLIIIETSGHIPHEEVPDAVRKPLTYFLR